MAWIKVQQSLPNHRKVMLLSDRLDISAPHAVGLLTVLWLWCLDNSVDGVLVGVSRRMISRAAMWEGDPEVFVESLVSCGFLEQEENGYAIHDWHDYAGKLVEEREKEKERGRKRREDKKTTPSTENPPDAVKKSTGRPSDDIADVQNKESGRPAPPRAEQSRAEKIQPSPLPPTGDGREKPLLVSPEPSRERSALLAYERQWLQVSTEASRQISRAVDEGMEPDVVAAIVAEAAATKPTPVRQQEQFFRILSRCLKTGVRTMADWQEHQQIHAERVAKSQESASPEPRASPVEPQRPRYVHEMTDEEVLGFGPGGVLPS